MCRRGKHAMLASMLAKWSIIWCKSEMPTSGASIWWDTVWARTPLDMRARPQKVVEFHASQVRRNRELSLPLSWAILSFFNFFPPGLDPARPGFENSAGPDSSLDKSDAEFVDVIHSSAGTLGYMQPMGHVDFYPNNGKAHQPGCKGILKEMMGTLRCVKFHRIRLNEFYFWNSEACSHGRSHQFFAESITNRNGFAAYPCESWEAYESGKCRSGAIPMGDATPRSAKGVYYLRTTDSAPFAMGRK